jgi:hypothetical protein
MESLKQGWSRLKAGVGLEAQPDPEPQSLLSQALQQVDEATTLTKTQRAYGFLTCLSLSLIFGFLVGAIQSVTCGEKPKDWINNLLCRRLHSSLSSVPVGLPYCTHYPMCYRWPGTACYSSLFVRLFQTCLQFVPEFLLSLWDICNTWPIKHAALNTNCFLCLQYNVYHGPCEAIVEHV